jgi:hypothetical protein
MLQQSAGGTDQNVHATNTCFLFIDIFSANDEARTEGVRTSDFSAPDLTFK